MNPTNTAPSALESPHGLLHERMLRGDVMAAACPSREILKHLTSRWGVLVLLSLIHI